MTPQQPRHALAGLIDLIGGQNGWSDAEIARRATKAGHPLSKSNVSRIRTTDVVSLTASTIHALAAGLGAPASVVARAAVLSMGIRMLDADHVDLETAIRSDISLTARDRQILLSTLRIMRGQPPTS